MASRFIVMELLVGQDLARVASRGALIASQVAEYVRQACRALAGDRGRRAARAPRDFPARRRYPRLHRLRHGASRAWWALMREIAQRRPFLPLGMPVPEGHHVDELGQLQLRLERMAARLERVLPQPSAGRSTSGGADNASVEGKTQLEPAALPARGRGNSQPVGARTCVIPSSVTPLPGGCNRSDRRGVARSERHEASTQ